MQQVWTDVASMGDGMDAILGEAGVDSSHPIVALTAEYTDDVGEPAC
jgi:hypothetical protein